LYVKANEGTGYGSGVSGAIFGGLYLMRNVVMMGLILRKGLNETN